MKAIGEQGLWVQESAKFLKLIRWKEEDSGTIKQLCWWGVLGCVGVCWKFFQDSWLMATALELGIIGTDP